MEGALSSIVGIGQQRRRYAKLALRGIESASRYLGAFASDLASRRHGVAGGRGMQSARARAKKPAVGRLTMGEEHRRPDREDSGEGQQAPQAARGDQLPRRSAAREGRELARHLVGPIVSLVSFVAVVK